MYDVWPWRKERRPADRPVLELLEDRLVPSIAEGTILVPTSPATNFAAGQAAYPSGIIGVDPYDGTQTAISVGPMYNTPQDVKEAPRDTPGVPPNAIFVADLFAGSEGQGAIIEYDPTTQTATIVADSADGFLNQPVNLAFANGYLYVADCTDHQLILLDPTHLLPNGHFQQTTVTLNGPGFNVPVGLMVAPGDPTSLYLCDEGGYVDDAEQGQIWKFTFTDPTHANQTRYGPAFPVAPIDVRHPNGITADLFDPTGTGLLCLAGGLDGGNPSVLLVNPDVEMSTIATGGEVVYGNGITMGDGYYGPDTIFLCGIAVGDPEQSEYYPAKIVAVNRETGEQHVLSSQDPYLSLPSFLSIFHTDGGSGYARRGPAAAALTARIPVHASGQEGMAEGTASAGDRRDPAHAPAGGVQCLDMPTRQGTEVPVGRNRTILTQQPALECNAVDAVFGDRESDPFS